MAIQIFVSFFIGFITYLFLKSNINITQFVVSVSTLLIIYLLSPEITKGLENKNK